jgi:hypothetical protein
VTYAMYNDGTCAGLPAVHVSTKPVIRTSAAPSDTVTFANAGTVFWQAAYSGDAANAPVKSGCAPLVIAKAKPIAWVALPRLVATTPVQATAGLGGATTGSRGLFTYAAFTDAACSRTYIGAGSAAVRGNDVEPSAPFRVEAAGTYYLQGSYSGDSNNEPTKSPCIAVVASVAPPPPPVTPRPPPIGASALCRDGTYSFSATRSGTCSWHGGVAVWYR